MSTVALMTRRRWIPEWRRIALLARWRFPAGRPAGLHRSAAARPMPEDLPALVPRLGTGPAPVAYT